MILLVYLSESLGRLGQNGGGGALGAHFCPLPSPRRTVPALRLTNSLAIVIGEAHAL